MICNTCGKEINPGMKFCAYCGTPTIHGTSNNQNSQHTVDPFKTEYRTEIPAEHPPKYRERAYIPPKKKENKVLIIIMGIIIVALIAAIVVLLMVNKNEEIMPNENEKIKEELVFTINDYPKTSEHLSYCLTGTVCVPDSGGTVSINGQTVTEFKANSGEVNWAKELWLANGINTFEITLSDNKKVLKKETIQIEFEPELLYPKGSVLVKSDSAGIFIRPTPAITNEFILYVPEYDYSTRFVCQGAEYIDGDKYTWCKVKVPDGSVGWVRSDIVRYLD